MRAASSMAAKSGAGSGAAVSGTSTSCSNTAAPWRMTGTGSGLGVCSPTSALCSNRRPPKTRGAAGPRELTTATASARKRLDKDVLAATLHDDLFRVLEPAHDVDDALLGFLDLAQANRPADLHLLLERLRGASRLVPEDALLEFLARAAHRQRQVLAVDLAQHALQGAVVQAHQVVEDEHQLANLGSQLAVGAIEVLQDLLLRASVDRGQHVDQELGAADGCEVARDDRAELALEHLFDLFDDLGRCAVHGRDPQGDLGANLGQQV